MCPDDPRYRSGAHRREPDTPPSQPAALRVGTYDQRRVWVCTTASAEPGAALVSVSILCRSCLRPFTIAPPRFVVEADGVVLARDEGAVFSCRICNAAIGPLQLADWNLGRFE